MGSMTVAEEGLLPSSVSSTQTRIRTFHGLSGEAFWPHKAKKSWKPSVEKVSRLICQFKAEQLMISAGGSRGVCIPGDARLCHVPLLPIYHR
jgi:hypothetical protein